jgi:glycosyltransferase involved in cell wall biosynthesis
LLKIIFCTDGIFPHAVGGMQRHSALLIEELSKTGEVDIIVLHPHKQKNFAQFSNVQEVFIQDIDQKKNYLIETYNYSLRVYNVLVQLPDHLIYSQGLSVWYGIDKLKHRLIINPHGLEPYQAISLKDKIIALPFKLVFNNLFRRAAVIISLGGFLTKILKNIVSDASRVVILPNAVNIPSIIPERSWNNDHLNILFVGRFASNKGISILMQAIRELNADGYEKKITYNLAGKGPLFEYYTKNFEFSNVNYLGFVSDEDLDNLYNSNDLFVLPTLFEGMPTVVLEAMSRKMPVIVSNVGATSELVDETNGYLIKKNSVKALKEAIISFYELPQDEKLKMSECSFKKVADNFTWQKVAEKHLELFRSLKENSHKFM